MKYSPFVALALGASIVFSADEGAKSNLPIITLPVRVHLVQSDTMPDMHTTLMESDVRRIFGKVNMIWGQAGIQFEIESIGPTIAKPLPPGMRFKSEFERVHAMIPKERLSPTAIDVCYVKNVRPNGFYYGEPVVVKDTASLREVEGGIDEPLPRVTSHEIGHALGLKHRQDTFNLMASGTTGFKFNDAEIAIARAKAQRKLDKRETPQPPIDLGSKNAANPGAPNYSNATVLLPNGALESYFRRAVKDGIGFFRTRSTDNANTWSEPELIPTPSKIIWGGPMPMVANDGEVHLVIPTMRGEGHKPAVDRFIDLFEMHSSEGRTKWTEPTRIFEGYVGSLQGVFQLKCGRIIVPFGAWVAGAAVAPPTGSNVVTCVCSDDNGTTWKRSSAALTSPCHENNNGNNYGAIEPTLIELKDGRVWMLIRTQDGYLYESYSKDGAEWSPAQRSRFHSSDSPAFPVRLADGRIVVFWNNCEVAPKVGKDGVYSGRDALHAAISDDDGKTWEGFREVYRDSTRNGSPPKSGDRGTAYPHATVTADGHILLVSGQGAERRRRFLIDPDWLSEKKQTETFALDADTWHLFKGFGKPERYWRDRVQGPEIITHPDKPDAKVMHLRLPDDRDADGATWNFPNGQQGKLTLRVRFNKGSSGTQIGLADRLFEPCDDNGEKKSAFALTIDANGKLNSDGEISVDAWHTLELEWNQLECTVKCDGQDAGSLRATSRITNGLSYLRLRSLATASDQAGCLIESVSVEVE